MRTTHDVDGKLNAIDGAASESSALWVDHGVTPAQAVPRDPELAAKYLGNALTHPVFERWNWQRLIKVYGALPDGRRAKPKVREYQYQYRDAVGARVRKHSCSNRSRGTLSHSCPRGRCL